MTSIIKVDNIQNASGTSAVTVDSSGIVDMPNTVMYDTYRLTSNVTTAGVMTNWEQPDDAIATTVGDSMSVSSGIFTFPRTGVYRVGFFGAIDNASGDNVTSLDLEASQDGGSNYDLVAFARTGETGTGTTNTSTIYAECVVNIDNLTNCKIKLSAGSMSAGSTILANTGYNMTYICFQYLAPAQ